MMNGKISSNASTNEGTLKKTSHKFSENGSFDFVAIDDIGNITTTTVTIKNIDKVSHVITIDDYSKDPTNQVITVTASTNEGTLNESSYTFKENGSFTFNATDDAGNSASETVTISNIDKTYPDICSNLNDFNILHSY